MPTPFHHFRSDLLSRQHQKCTPVHVWTSSSSPGCRTTARPTWRRVVAAIRLTVRFARSTTQTAAPCPKTVPHSAGRTILPASTAGTGPRTEAPQVRDSGGSAIAFRTLTERAFGSTCGETLSATSENEDASPLTILRAIHAGRPPEPVVALVKRASRMSNSVSKSPAAANSSSVWPPETNWSTSALRAVITPGFGATITVSFGSACAVSISHRA